MKRYLEVTTLVAALVAASPGPSHATQNTELRRFAFVVGANDGGADRTTLRFAQSDAQTFAQVVGELGGVAETDVELLLDPSSADIDSAFVRMRDKLSAARQHNVRVELLVYYSGHSDETGLLLSGARYDYQRLRGQIRDLPADVKIAILDSCSSGAFTRTKGGTRRPSFVVDEASQVRGHAFLSSSSADEAAQESDHIGASVFTHYLVSGLRGGADTNRDSRVTLSEAYQFAFNETVARTETTKYGAQHPAYDMHLIGTGDVVITDLRATSASLVLADSLAGRLFIRDSAGRLVIEMRKAAGAPVVLGLGPDRYQIILQNGDRRSLASIDLSGGGTATLNQQQFRRVAVQDTVARGAAPGDADVVVEVDPADTGAPAATGMETFPLGISLIPPLSSSGRGSVHVLSLNLLAGAGGRLEGAEFGALVNIRTDGVKGGQFAGIANINGGDAEAVQAAGVSNWNHGSMDGAQFAGVANWNGGPFYGGQAAGVANWNGGDFRGVQVAGTGNWNDAYFDGIQAAGVLSWNGGGFHGAQLGGVASVTGGDVRGLQAAGVASVANGDMRGAQISGVANVANGRVGGAQVGLVNIGGVIDGAQVGLVNIAQRVNGVQLGLVNVADEIEGLPIGMVSVVRNGGHRSLEVWTSDIVPATVGLKLGSRRLYSMLAVGSTEDNVLVGLGLGLHTERDRYYFDVDLTSYSVFEHQFGDADNDLMAQLRAMVGIPILGDLSLFGGLSLTGLLAFDGKLGESLTPLEAKQYQADGVYLRLSPGLFGGIAY